MQTQPNKAEEWLRKQFISFIKRIENFLQFCLYKRYNLWYRWYKKSQKIHKNTHSITKGPRTALEKGKQWHNFTVMNLHDLSDKCRHIHDLNSPQAAAKWWMVKGKTCGVEMSVLEVIMCWGYHCKKWCNCCLFEVWLPQKKYFFITYIC